MDVGHDISLHRFRVFLTVVDRRGYTAAAGLLGMTQPSVSYHVKALERDLGVELMVYRNRSIHLTAEGEEVYRAAKIILGEGERLGETIQRMRAGESGRIALGASIAFEHQFFFDLVLAPFVKEHPEVHVSLRFGHSLDLVEAVSTGSLDMAYVNDWRIPAELQFEFLHASDLVFLVAADHPLASGSTVTPEDIEVAGLIVAPIESGEVISYHEMLRRAGIRNPRTTVEVDGIQPRKLAAQAGLGVLATFAPPYAGDNAMEPLRTLKLSRETPRIEFGIITREGRPRTPLMDDMGSWLRTVTAGS